MLGERINWFESEIPGGTTMNGRGPGVTGRTLIHVTQSIKCVMYYSTGTMALSYDSGITKCTNRCLLA